MNNQKIIILSIPFWRVAKVLLSENLLKNLSSESSKIVVITPLDLSSIKTNFSNTYPFEVISFSAHLPNKFWRLVYNITEIFRVNGYWFRFRDKGMKYYSFNMYRDLGELGKDTEKPFIHRAIIFTLSFLGSFRLWKLFDPLLGKSFHYPDSLNSYLDTGSNICLVQSASWGLQDRMLASWARKNSVDGFLLPYTTDQIIMNGFLLMDYKRIFLQGPLERMYAEKFQSCKRDTLYNAGSLWLRNIDEILKKGNAVENKLNKISKIVYAGVSPLYYPREAELKAVELISKFLKNCGRNENIEFIYRPYIVNDSEKSKILSTIKHLDNVIMQWPKYQINDLSKLSVDSFFESISLEIDQLKNVEIFIMSVSTSLSIDVSYIAGSTVVSSMIDHEGFLRKRYTSKLVESDTLKFVPGARIVYSYPELIEVIEKTLKYKIELSNSSSSILMNWDYNNPDFPNKIKELLEIS